MKDKNGNRAGYKNTKVGWLPEDWEVRPLGSIGLFSKGAGISNNEKKETGIPCITYGDIYTKYNFKVKNLQSFIDQDTAKKSKRIKKNDILFAGTGETLDEIGKCVAYTIDKEAYAGGDIIILSPNDVDSVYLSYSLNSDLVTAHRRKLGQGHSVVHIYHHGLKKLFVPFPPLIEQNKIAEILSIWDDVIDDTQRLVERKKQQKKALIQQFQMKQNYSFGREKWNNKNLVDLIKPISRPIPKPENTYLSIGIRSHGKGTFRKMVEQPEKIMMDTLYRVDTNDLIVNITFAWEGAIAIATEEDSGGLVSHRFPTYRIKETETDIDFFRNLILTKRFIWDLGLISPGGAGRNRVLNQKDFLKLKVVVPSIDAQKEIGKTLVEAERELHLLENYLSAFEKQKRGLMQKLLTGEVRVTV
jgi:type I restriction enzyme, S subunit